MKERDLWAEIEVATSGIQQCHLDRLHALGVSAETIANLGAHQPTFGVTSVDELGAGIYQPGGEHQYITQPVFDQHTLIDLIAWRTTDPARWLWRCGAGWALGINSIDANSWTDDPLVIEATPLDWLRGGATGLCILNWDALEVRQLLRVKSIVAEQRVARQLRSALLKPLYFPEINVKETLRHAA